MFLYLIFFIIQYLYLIIFYSTTQNYEIEDYEYEIQGEKRRSTIYKRNPSPNTKSTQHTKKKNLLLFISGAYNLEVHPYIIKTMDDIESYLPHISDTYDMICYENKNISSIIIYDDVAQFIQKLHDAANATDTHPPEIVLIGYSAGGVVASHIMSRIKHLPATFKLITYDTPWQIRDNVDAFSKYMFYRVDAIFFYKVYLTYLWHYNADQFAPYMKSLHVGYKWNGANEMFDLIKNIHQYDDIEFYKNTGFNFDQSPTLKVINIYHQYDPLIFRSAHNLFYENHKDNIHFENHFIEQKSAGHCSDMAFSLKYLDILVPAILG